MALFFWRALTYRQPIVDLRAYLNRNFAFGSFFTFASPIRVFLQIFIMSNLLGRPPPNTRRAAVCQKLSVAEAKQIEGF